MHFVGQNFEQASWEILFNLNCNGGGCNNNTTFGNALWIGDNSDQVIDHFGAALGQALSVLGQNITFSQVVGQMHAKWITDTGVFDANRARAVFTHHGL